MLEKIVKFIKKYWIDILISWFSFYLVMFYYGNDIMNKLLVFPIISFFLVLLFYLELERKKYRLLFIIQIIIGMILGLFIQIRRENIMIFEGLIYGGIFGLITPVWVIVFSFLKKKIGKYI